MVILFKLLDFTLNNNIPQIIHIKMNNYLCIVHSRWQLWTLPCSPALVVHVEKGIDHEEKVPRRPCLD